MLDNKNFCEKNYTSTMYKMPSVIYRAYFNDGDLRVFGNYGTPQKLTQEQIFFDIIGQVLPSQSIFNTYASIPLNYQIDLEEIYNDSNQVTTSSRMEVLNVPQPSGPRGLDTYTMTEYFTVYTNFGIITFQDVKIGTNTTTTTYPTTYGNFTQDKNDVITLTRTILRDLKGEISGMYLDITIPVVN